MIIFDLISKIDNVIYTYIHIYIYIYIYIYVYIYIYIISTCKSNLNDPIKYFIISIVILK